MTVRLVGFLSLLLVVAWFWHRSPESAERSGEPAPISSAAPPSKVPADLSKEREPGGKADAADAGLSLIPQSINLPPGFDTAKYPRGLKSVIEEVLETRQQGWLAFELASVLKKCPGAEARMDLIQQALPTVSDLRLRKYYEAGYAELQKLSAQCQTLGSDLGAMRIKLLQLAHQSKVESSAAELYGEGIADAQLLASLLRDAHGGDLSSIVHVATAGRVEGQFANSQVSINRYVLLLALNDDATRQWVAPLVVEVQRMGVARTLAPGQAGELEARFQAALATKSDVVNQSAAALDAASKQEAAATLQRLIKKQAKPAS